MVRESIASAGKKNGIPQCSMFNIDYFFEFSYVKMRMILVKSMLLNESVNKKHSTKVKLTSFAKFNFSRAVSLNTFNILCYGILYFLPVDALHSLMIYLLKKRATYKNMYVIRNTHG